ncbi:MAG TPA: DUF4954 family protein [Planctomycetota bacterium]|jgi:hypothetical protein
MPKYRVLTETEKKSLESQGCRAVEWTDIQVAEPFDSTRVRNVTFLGPVKIGSVAGVVKRGNLAEPCGIYDATLADVNIADGCLIKKIGSRLSGYDIGARAVIEDCGLISAEAGASFGCGVVVDAVNEGGGRGVPLYPELSAQVAHLLALHRYRPQLIAKLESMVAARVAKAKAARAQIGSEATIRGVKTMLNVTVGAGARIEDAALLENGTILSEPKAPAIVGSGVTAREFVIAEGSSVTDGAMLKATYVGQGCGIGKQFSAENCLFFANCEAYHGESVALFGGPYTVTHHKSTLLIAAQLSFYNAGSGTNQSNHMYKLGPVHQGIMERGSKTGSFSYLLWPCRIGPFSVVIGKNMANFDLGDLPFSYIIAEGNKSTVTPGFNLYTVGTVRDGAKWPARDRRKSSVKRDLIHFPVFNPLTVERMVRGEQLLNNTAKVSDRSLEEVSINGGTIKRLLLKTGAKYYATAIEAYLCEKVLDRVEPLLQKGAPLTEVRQQLVARASLPAAGTEARPTWADLGGMLIAKERLEVLSALVESGAVPDLEALQAKLQECFAAYGEDEWNFVSANWEARYGSKLSEITAAGLAEAAAKLLAARSKAIKMTLSDAEKEFSETAQIGFGVDGDVAARRADFESLRGTYAGNKVVKQLNAELAAIEQRVAAFKSKAETLK